MLKDKHTIFLLLFIIFLLFILNLNIDFYSATDESLHQAQGYFYYDYFKTLISGDIMGLNKFLQLYNQKFESWYIAAYHPPLQAMFKALLYAILGANDITAKISVEILFIFGIILIFKLGNAIFKNKTHALATAILYGLLPVNFFYGRNTFLTCGISTMIVGWFYYFFKESRYLKIKFGESRIIRININNIISALFLTAATLMKYHSLIYVFIFILILSLYELLKKIKYKTQFNFIYIKKFISQSIIFIILSFWWLKFSLFDQHFLKRVFFEGLGHKFYDYTFWHFSLGKNLGLITQIIYYPLSLIYHTNYIALFIIFSLRNLIPKVLKFDDEIKIKILFFVIAVYLFATFGLGNNQLRYAIHMVPFVTILVIDGILRFASWLRTKLKINLSIIFGLICIALILSDIHHTFSYIEKRGKQTNELYNYFLTQPEPRLVIYMHGFENFTTSNFQVAFNLMRTKKEYNPKYMQTYFRWVSYETLFNDKVYKNFIDNLNSLPIKKIIVVPQHTYHIEGFLKKFDKDLLSKNFSRINLTHFTLYTKD